MKWMVGVYNYEQENTGFNGGPRYNILTAAWRALQPTPGRSARSGSTRSRRTRRSRSKTRPCSLSVSYDPTDRWHLTLEGRYAKDELTTNNTVQVGGNCARVLKAEFKSFTPRGTVRFDFAEDLNVYFSVARGNKPGDFNTSLCGATVPADEFRASRRSRRSSVDEERR